jgi:hypothetical protein
VKEDSDVKAQASDTAAPSEPGELIQQGLGFLSGLARTLSDPESTKKLVDSLVREDKEDGKTYLKIPVESSKSVENILGMIGSLMKS